MIGQDRQDFPAAPRGPDGSGQDASFQTLVGVEPLQWIVIKEEDVEASDPGWLRTMGGNRELNGGAGPEAVFGKGRRRIRTPGAEDRRERGHQKDAKA